MLHATLAGSLHAVAAGFSAVWGAMGPIGWAILAVTALAGIIALVATHLKNVESAEDKLKKAIAETDKAIAKHESKQQEVTNDLQTLSIALNETTDSYESQLDAINAVTQAYGVQASALDVLSGNYGDLITKMTTVAKQEADLSLRDAKEILTQHENALEAYRQGVDVEDLGEDNFYLPLEDITETNFGHL